MYKTAGCALAAGGIAAVMGNPADLSLIRKPSTAKVPARATAQLAPAQLPWWLWAAACRGLERKTCRQGTALYSTCS